MENRRGLSRKRMVCLTETIAYRADLCGDVSTGVRRAGGCCGCFCDLCRAAGGLCKKVARRPDSGGIWATSSRRTSRGGGAQRGVACPASPLAVMVTVTVLALRTGRAGGRVYRRKSRGLVVQLGVMPDILPFSLTDGTLMFDQIYIR